MISLYKILLDLSSIYGWSAGFYSVQRGWFLRGSRGYPSNWRKQIKITTWRRLFRWLSWFY